VGILNKVPERGDIIWLDFDPKKGREQKGHRPALVISHFKYNKAFGLAIVLPITTKEKGFAIEVKLPENCSVKGVILTNQIQTIDWLERNIAYETQVNGDTLEAVLKRINLLIN